MSQISNTHSFVAYDPKAKQVAFEGQRLAKIKYRLTQAAKDRGEVEKQAVCVSVPKLAMADILAHAGTQAIIRDAIEQVQDDLIRSLHEAGHKEVADSQIGLDALTAYYVATNSGSGGRLNGEDIKVWFKETLQDDLMVAFAEKLGISDTPTDEEAKKIEQIVAVYRDKIAMLASPKTLFDAATKTKIITALELVKEDELAKKFIARVSAMQEKTVDMLAL